MPIHFVKIRHGLVRLPREGNLHRASLQGGRLRSHHHDSNLEQLKDSLRHLEIRKPKKIKL